MRMSRLLVNLTRHELPELFGREDALKLNGHLLESFEVLGPSAADDAQVGIFEMHAVESIELGTVGQR